MITEKPGKGSMGSIDSIATLSSDRNRKTVDLLLQNRTISLII